MSVETHNDFAHEITSLRRLFRERRLSVASMDRPLKLATGLALAGLLAVVLLIALRDVHASDVVIGRNSGVLVKVSLPIFITTLTLLSIGFAYLLTGAVFAGWPVAMVSLVLITGAIGVEAGAFGKLLGINGFLHILPGWAQWTTRALLALVWLLAGAVGLLRRKQGAEPGPGLRLIVLAGNALIFGAYFIVLWVATPTSGQLNLFPQVVDLIMTDIVLLVYPVLLVAAVDFGEWGGLLGERVVAELNRRRGRWLAPLAVAVSLGLAVFGYLNFAQGHPAQGSVIWHAARAVLMVAAALALVILAGRGLRLHHRPWPAALNFAVIFAGCAVLSYVISPVAATLVDTTPSTATLEQVSKDGQFTATADVLPARGGHGKDAFTLLVPRSWLHTSSPTLDIWTNYAVPGHHLGPDAPFERIGVSVLPLKADAATIAAASNLTVSGGQQVDNDWQHVTFTGDAASGVIYARPDPADPRSTIIVEGFAKAVPLADVQPDFIAIAHTVRASNEPPARLPEGGESTSAGAAQHSFDQIQTINFAISGGLLAVLLLALMRWGRRWQPYAVASVLVFALMSLAALLYFGDSLGRELGTTHWPYVSMYGLITAVGVLGLFAIAMTPKSATWRRVLLPGLITLDVTVLALTGMTTLYEHALKASRVSVWAAITVLVAIGWDVTMSGESLTNRSSRQFPRVSRLLGFLGYVLLLAATVLFYTAERTAVNGASTEPFFEPEAVTQGGLFRVAFPVAVLLFLLRFGRTRGSEPAAASVAESVQPEEASV